MLEGWQRIKERRRERRTGVSEKSEKDAGYGRNSGLAKKDKNRINSQRGLHRMRCGITFAARQLPGHCGRMTLPGENKKRGNGVTSSEDTGEQRGRLGY